MTGISRTSLIFVFILVSVFGFAEKASAYNTPQIYTSDFYHAGDSVTVWVDCGSYFRGGIVGYFLDRTPPIPLTPDSLYDTSFNNGEAKYDYDTCGGLFSDPTGTLNFGTLGIGTHTIHTFFINAGGYTDSSGYPLDDVAGYFSKTFEVCVSNYGSSCAYNSCGDPNGYIQCNGSCSAGPVERSYYNTACTLYSNSNNCGVTNTASGRIYCDPGTCTGSAPSAPPNVPGIGSPCNINACGDPSGYLTCSSNGLSAICSGPVVQRFNYGTSCSLTSLPNACGQTTTVAGSGTIGCDSFTCTGTPPAAPSNNGCVPTAPVVQGPGTVPAFNPDGYNIYATGYTPIPGAKLNYYFEWSRDGTTWSGSAPSWPTIP